MLRYDNECLNSLCFRVFLQVTKMTKPRKFTVRVKEGQIQGIKQRSPIFFTDYYAFYGVPYAQPPIEDLRFKNPVKAKPWKGVRIATHPRDPCIQFSTVTGQILGSEDCLFVNIYTPELPEDNHPAKAVVVFLHPGSFLWGSPNPADLISPNPADFGSPDYLMHHDVVYVTIGYRLNIFGFLNLNLENCSGNQGLKDVIMAFQWIRENIHVFNGDPHNITVVGSSAGAMLIHLLLLSPAINGLFHKAIIMGLNAFNCLIPHCEDHVPRAFELASENGFKGNNIQKLLRFLKKMEAPQLIHSIINYHAKLDKYTLKSYLTGPFSESVDSTIIPVNPRELISNMERIPILFGICDREAICGFIKSEEETIKNNFHSAFRLSSWGWPYNLTDEELDEFNNQINSFYLENIPENETINSQQINIATDAAFSEVYETLINPIAELYPVYVYKFKYQSETSILRKYWLDGFIEPVDGSYHGDDATFWARQITPKTKTTQQMVETFSKLLCSYAKTGDPNHEDFEPHWEPTTPENPCYLEINEKSTMVNGKLNGERFKFWDSLKAQFKRD